jgi:hypothetical protein
MNGLVIAGQIVGALTTDLAARICRERLISVQHLNHQRRSTTLKQAGDITAQAAVDLHSDSLSSPDSLSGTIKLGEDHRRRLRRQSS